LVNIISLHTRDIDSDALSRPSNAEALSVEQNYSGVPDNGGPMLANLLRDAPNWLSAVRNLRETDVIILLTPVVIPISLDQLDISDPFEPLGRSLAKRHSRIRQIPYTQRSVDTMLLDFSCLADGLETELHQPTSAL